MAQEKTCWIGFRTLPKEAEQIKKHCLKLDLPVSIYIRHLIRDDMKVTKKKPSK